MAKQKKENATEQSANPTTSIPKKPAMLLRSWEVITFSVFSSVVCWVANLVNSLVPNAYMDEIFHIPQAQLYCDGNFDYWNPKITTPPGLYFASLPFSLITKCSIDVLRATNIVFHLGNIFVMNVIQKQLHGTSIFSSLAVALMPINFFFTFLYYTDPGCIFCLLLMYLFFLRKQHYLSALAGFLALFFRQTSIVWVFFVATLTLLETLEPHLEALSLRKKSMNRRWLTPLTWDLIKNCFGYGVVGVAFLAFLKINDGITLGDRKAHEAVLHIPQLGYFLIFSLLFGAPYLLTLRNLKLFIDFAFRRPLLILLASFAIYGLFENFIHIHPYLIADNRHYTFYLWRKFLSKESVRQGFVILYIFVGHCLYSCVHHMGRVWNIIFVICLSLTIVPAKLIEFRYFLWPFILLRLHFRQETHQTLAEILAAIAINCITFYMFLYGTFIWQHDPKNIQRFMW